MIKLESSQPIGIFDSGIGGLTVAKTVIERLPHENVIYFGDTAHFPYGDKSKSAIQECTQHVVDKLLDHDCKVILIACNSASAAAYDFLKQHINDRAYLINIIDPILQSIAQTHAHKNWPDWNATNYWIQCIRTKTACIEQRYSTTITGHTATRLCN